MGCDRPGELECSESRQALLASYSNSGDDHNNALAFYALHLYGQQHEVTNVACVDDEYELNFTHHRSHFSKPIAANYSQRKTAIERLSLEQQFKT